MIEPGNPSDIGKKGNFVNDSRETRTVQGAMALVLLLIEAEETGASELIPCYVLSSVGIIWQE